MYKKYIVTNFAYGTGPYLRTTELAIQFNNELEKRGQERLGILVPWVYGEKQRRIMLEEFGEHEREWPGEIFLDKKLGEIIGSVFYGDNTYEESLHKWISAEEEASERAHKHLSGKISSEGLSGKHFDIHGGDIVVELSRSPRVRYNVSPAYFTSFAYISEILEKVLLVDDKRINIDHKLVKKGIETAKRVEEGYRIYCMGYPVTFSNVKKRSARHEPEVIVPPIIRPPAKHVGELERGIYVTVTGIPGLDRLYKNAGELGLKLYSNDPGAVTGSEKALPDIISNKNILLQFARSGWGSVWVSMLGGTPIVVPEFDPKDDPEIYFNNRIIEDFGIGIVYRGQPLEEILVDSDRVKQSYEAIVENLGKKWGTIDGNKYSARLFAEDFLRG